MAKNLNFNQVKDKHIDTLRLYVPIVARVHGKSHPEFYQVEKLFNKIDEKLKRGTHELNAEFNKLRESTNNYTVPEDVCESYQAVYNMLSELDKAYHLR